MKRLSVLFLLLCAGLANGQPMKISTSREWRPMSGHADGGHVAHFFDHKKYKEAKAGVQSRFIKALPAAPESFDFGTKTTYPMYLNDQLGCCFYTACCHHQRTITSNVGPVDEFDMSVFRQRYLTLSGGDNGLYDEQMQKEWRDRYLANVKEARIIDWLYVNVNDDATLDSAIYHFIGCQFTMTVPRRWIENSGPGFVWDVPCPVNNSGHATHLRGKKSNGNRLLVTWSVTGEITRAGLKACDPSAFVVFNVRMFDKKGYAPNGLHVTHLAKVWQDGGGKQIPAAVIAAFPPPGDDPAPVPVPVPFKEFGIGTFNGIKFRMVPLDAEVYPAGTKAKLDALQKALDAFRVPEQKKATPKGKAFNADTFLHEFAADYNERLRLTGRDDYERLLDEVKAEWRVKK